MARPIKTLNSDKIRAHENHKTPITPWTELGTAVILQAVQDLDKVIKNLNSTDDVDARKRYLDQFNSLKRFLLRRHYSYVYNTLRSYNLSGSMQTQSIQFSKISSQKEGY